LVRCRHIRTTRRCKSDLTCARHFPRSVAPVPHDPLRSRTPALQRHGPKKVAFHFRSRSQAEIVSLCNGKWNPGAEAFPLRNHLPLSSCLGLTGSPAPCRRGGTAVLADKSSHAASPLPPLLPRHVVPVNKLRKGLLRYAVSRPARARALKLHLGIVKELGYGIMN